MGQLRRALIWAAYVSAVAVPIAAAAASPLLAWRQPVYIAAGFAGVVAMALLLTPPLLAGGVLPGLPARRGRRVHRWVGATLVALIVMHVAGLWVTSPPDVIDALTFTSPTPFSAWGVVAMWAIFAAASLAVFRARLRVPVWRVSHSAMVSIAVAGSVVHAMLIEGTMGSLSKAMLCGLLVIATARTITKLRPWAMLLPRGPRP